MEVRLVKPEERLDSSIISTVSFHGRMDITEGLREEFATHTGEDWGAYAENGEMMAHVINNHMFCRINGTTVSNGGIGGVSTLPEYRVSGAVRGIFEKLLPAEYERGEVISSLYPFNHKFYRKFGYETAICRNVYEFAPSVLSDYRFEGTAKLWKDGESKEEYDRIYKLFADKLNLVTVRDGSKHVEGNYYQSRRFCYLLSDENGTAISYVVFQDEHRDPQAMLRVIDAAWYDDKGFCAILGFLARFSADYGLIRFQLPTGVELINYIAEPYHVSKYPECGYMVRAINAKVLLETLAVPCGESFTIAVTDGMIEKNNRTFAVSADGVTETDACADITVSAGHLAQLVCGIMSFDEAAICREIKVCGNSETLRKVFPRRSVYICDQF